MKKALDFLFLNPKSNQIERAKHDKKENKENAGDLKNQSKTWKKPNYVRLYNKKWYATLKAPSREYTRISILNLIKLSEK